MSIVCHSRKFIYYRPRKMASKSIKAALGTLCTDKDVFDMDPRAGHEHKYPDNFIGTLCTKEQWDQYLKITLCRNPWDKEVSLFWGGGSSDPRLNRQPNVQAFSSFKEAAALFNEWLRAKEQFGGYSSFDEYVANEYNRYYFASGKTTFYDRIIRFESLEEDFRSLCADLGKEKPPSLPKIHIHRRKRPNHYRDYYTRESRLLVQDKMSRYIKHFGYKF